MLLELMSNGTLAELPPENIPDNIAMPEEPAVMLLLPHNKYLLGTSSGKWIYASDKPGVEPKNVNLYDNETLSLLNENSSPTILTAGAVNTLRKELLQLTEPPGQHEAAVLMLRTFMRNNPVFENDASEFLDEKNFYELMKNDLILAKAYWALRFALARGEMETLGRLKAWLKAEPENFAKDKFSSRIWFSLLDIPDKNAMIEIEELSFSRLELQRMVVHNISPLVLYNPLSGWLVMGRFGRVNETMFTVWAYLNHELWQLLREDKKMTVHDIIQAVWGEYETQQALNERAKYKGS